MPPNSLLPTPSLVSQFDKRNQTETKGGDDGNSYTLPVVLGIVFGALTLLIAVLAYQHQREILDFLLFRPAKKNQSGNSKTTTPLLTPPGTPQQPNPPVFNNSDTSNRNPHINTTMGNGNSNAGNITGGFNTSILQSRSTETVPPTPEVFPVE
ncbi:hypothetical protein B9Z19DRAFT_1132209 [Tuber borchii]|uniref:Uncharacterized protein n=1 Tax=Tuber borchii TaxID=42251 RepID=A0A2T6ZHH6_TUBBO|nr:hypothetical protein B9Z19DRAFT_1132209 [Tuber borchii]